MTNEFHKICITASQNRWCWRLSCSTCGQRDFRAALQPISADQLQEASLLDIHNDCTFPDWLGYLGLVIDELARSRKSSDKICQAWARQLSELVRPNSAIYPKLLNIVSGSETLVISDLEQVELSFKAELSKSNQQRS